jgi:Rrf2 family transcriptional regulator, cysteine metabolism repressor
MQLSRTVGYALQATLQLALSESRSPVPCSQLASEGHMPERFLLQILRNLVTHGILQSVRGVDGGYTLERKPEDISLLEVIEAVDGPLISGAPVAEGLPHESQGKLREALEQVTATSRRQLSEIKLASLLKKPAGAARGQSSAARGPGPGSREPQVREEAC